MNRIPLVALLLLAAALPALAQQQAVVVLKTVDDLKPVIATVEPVHELLARSRIAGTITKLTVREGDEVAADQKIAVVIDQKLLFQIEALASRIQAQEAERDQARVDLARTQQLRHTGFASQQQLDQAKTRLDVAQRTLQALQSDRQVVEQEAAEGAVLAPGAGRVLTVPVAEGGVVLAGETIATIAAKDYILRLQLPERHARFLARGDTILVGPRGLSAAAAGAPMRRGEVVLVYPEIHNGRVVADVRVSGLGDYFVGERTLVYIATGHRRALVIPRGFVYRRFGVSYARLKDGAAVVVQPGMPVDDGIEILAGLHPGDVVMKP